MAIMDIEVVNLKKASSDGKLKAFADVKFGGALIVKGFSVMDGQRGLFVSMPKKPGKNGQWFETTTPTSETFKREIEDKIMEAYDLG